MKKSTLIYLVVLLFFTQAKIYAQGSNEVPQIRAKAPTTAFWQGQYFKARISERFFYYHELHYRRINSLDKRSDFVGRMGQVYNRPGITYLANKYFELTLGPVITLRYSPEPDNEAFKKVVPDLRIWHQYLFAQPINRFKILHQIRIEHRWKQSNEIDAPVEFTNRWRYKLSIYIPLNKPQMQDKTWYLYPSNEIFFEKGTSKTNIFEENRFYMAAGYMYGNWQFFAGWMYTYGPEQGNLSFDYRQRNIIRTNVAYNIDLRKSKQGPTEGFLLPF